MVLRLFVLSRAGEGVSHESRIGDTCRCGGLGWAGLGTASMEVLAGPDDALVVGSVSRRLKKGAANTGGRALPNNRGL